MTGNPRIALVIDHPQRDLPGLILVARELCSAGATVYLVPLNLLGAELASLMPDFVLFNYLRRHIDSTLRFCLESGITYGVLDTEGGFYGDMNDYGATFTTDRSIIEGLKVMCVWGRKTRDYIVESEILPASKLPLTGLPRFDFYDQRLRGFFDPLPSSVKNPMILFNTKVAVANPGQHSVDKEIDLYLHRLGVPHDQVMAHLTIGRKTIEELMNLANRSAAENRYCQFVVRPHPHERLTTYQELINSDSSNLTVVREGTADRWIVASKAVIHRHCTTAIEAGFVGIPAISPQWIPSSANAPDAEKVSLCPTSHEELGDLIDAVLSGERVTTPDIERELERVEDEWLFRVDGDSHKRVAMSILEHLPLRNSQVSSRARDSFLRLDYPWNSLRGAVGRVAKLSHKALPRTTAELLYPAARRWGTSPKAFDVDAVTGILMSIENVAGDGSPKCNVDSPIPGEDYHWSYSGRSIVVRPVN